MGAPHRVTEAGAAAGVVSRSHETVLLELTTRRGLVLSSTQLADRVRLSTSSIPGICQQLARLGLVGQVGKVGKTFTWVATADGYALAELIREELGRPVTHLPPEPPLATVTALPPPEPPAVVVAAHPSGGRVEREEAIWRWLRQASRADLAGASHRLIDALTDALAEEGHL